MAPPRFISTPALRIGLRDFACSHRRKGFYSKRILQVAAFGTALAIGVWAIQGDMASRAAIRLFLGMSFFLLASTSLMATINGSRSLMREREADTLGLLLLTGVSHGEILVGKLIGCVLSNGVAILTVIPFLLLIVAAGGIASGQVLASLVVVVCTAMLTASFGVCSAASAKKSADANGNALVTGFVFIIVPAILAKVVFRFSPDGARAMSVVFALSGIIQGTEIPACLFNASLSIAIALIVTRIWQRWVLVDPPIEEPARAPAELTWVMENVVPFARRLRRKFPVSRVRGNPLTWKEYHLRLGGPPVLWPLCAISVGLFFLILLLFSYGNPISLTLSMCGIFCFAAFWFGSVINCASAFAGEKRYRTLGALLITDLSDREIIFGKLWGAIVPMAPWLLCGILLKLLPGETIGSYLDEQGSIAKSLAFNIHCMAAFFGYCGLTLWASFRFRNDLGVGLLGTIYPGWMFLHYGLAVFWIGAMRGVTVTFWVNVLIDVVFHLLLGLIPLCLLFKTLRKAPTTLAHHM